MGYTRARVDLTALDSNLRAVRRFLPSEVRIAAVVKANAYGHGILTVSKHLEEQVDYLAVATPFEALYLRQMQVKGPILIMGKTCDADLDRVAVAGLTPTISSLHQARALSQIAEASGVCVKVHVKIDTGFHRLGYTDMGQAEQDLLEMQQLKGLQVEGLFTHLKLTSAESDAEQMRRFDALIASGGFEKTIPLRHACDSIGAVAYPLAPYTMVRLGAILYGYCSRRTPFELHPVMQLSTRITEMRTVPEGEGIGYDDLYVTRRATRLATLAAGYADGIPRALSNVGCVWIHGQRAPIVGLICMDQCTVDVTDIDGHVAPGDTAVFFGDALDQLFEMAHCAGTNRNELLARVGGRVERIPY